MLDKKWLENSKLWMITDVAAMRGRDAAGLVRNGIDGGVDVVVVRFKSLGRDELISEASAVAAVCREYGVPWILSHNLDLFDALTPDGIHLGAGDPPIQEVKASVREGAVIGYSAHSDEEIEAAAKAGADYCWFSPVYKTRKGDTTLVGQGLAATKLALEKSAKLGTSERPFPVVLLGGVTPKTVGPLIEMGATMFAAIGALIGADDVRAAAEEFKSILGN